MKQNEEFTMSTIWVKPYGTNSVTKVNNIEVIRLATNAGAHLFTMSLDKEPRTQYRHPYIFLHRDDRNLLERYQ